MNVNRQVRRDLAGMDPKRVREILEIATVAIDAEITRMTRALSRCGTVDADDLRAVGRIAALEASQTHDPRRGGTLQTWIGNCVRWRISEVMQDAGDSASVEIALGLAHDFEEFQPTHEPEEAYELAQARQWVLRSLAGLTPRQKIILVQRLANNDESDAELAAGFGVDKSQVWRDLASAVAVLAVRIRGERPCGVPAQEEQRGALCA